MGGLALGCDLHLQPALMPAIDLHFGRLANDDKIGLDFGINFHKGVRGNAVAPFFHIAKVIRRPAFEQAQSFANGKPIDHARRGAFFIARATRIQDAIFHFALEWIPLPGGRVANATVSI